MYTNNKKFKIIINQNNISDTLENQYKICLIYSFIKEIKKGLIFRK